MNIKFYLFSFLILTGLMSCQKEEAFAPEEDAKSSQDLLTRSGGDQEYESVVINGIRIMTKNLNVGTFASTVGELNYWQFDDSGVQKWGYDNNENNCDTLGGLYEWWEMMTGGYTDKITTAKAQSTVLSGDISRWDTLYGIKTIQVGDVWHVQGICPDGWHLPSREEWLTIVSSETAPPAELGLTLSGRRECNGRNFQYADRFGFYWSSTPTRNYSAWYRRFSRGSNLSEYVDGARSTGHPVRCVKTEPDFIHIPDSNFKAYLVRNFDANGDGGITVTEALLVTGTIDVKFMRIKSLEGIEFFVNITELMSIKNELTNINLSKNTALTKLTVVLNSLTTLDISNNRALTELVCYHNQLTTLNVRNNQALTLLYCSSNLLTTLDVSNNIALKMLYCFNNKLTTIDVSSNLALTDLSCGANPLTGLNVSNNIALKKLVCYETIFSSLDVLKNTALVGLYCRNSKLIELDLSNNIALTELYCQDSKLASLDVSKNTALINLSCYGNQLTQLNISKNTALTDLNCHSNQLTQLDLSANTALTNLFCTPMNDTNGVNLLQTITIKRGQDISNFEKPNETIIIPID